MMLSTVWRLGNARVMRYALITLLLLGGCSAQTAKNMQILWVDGKCVMFVDGISAAQAKDLQQGWRSKKCEIEVSGHAGEEQLKNPPPQPVQEGEG